MLREGEKTEFDPQIFELGSWIWVWSKCLSKDQNINAQLVEKLGTREYLIKTSSLKKEFASVEVKVTSNIREGLYKFGGELEPSAEEDDRYKLKINPIGERIEERDYKRINIYQSVKFTIIEKPLLVGNQYRAQIEDISAGGAKLITTLKLVPSNLIELEFAATEFPFSNLRAEVVRSKQLCKLDTRIYEVGVELSCSKEERDKISNYVEEQELKYKEQGLISGDKK